MYQILIIRLDLGQIDQLKKKIAEKKFFFFGNFFWTTRDCMVFQCMVIKKKKIEKKNFF